MKRLHFIMKAAFVPVLLISAGLLTGCEKEGSKKDPNESAANSIVLKRSSGNKGRLQIVKQSKRLPKRHRLAFVASISAPQDRQDLMWSATSVAVNPNNTAENNIVYVTWHSNYQAQNPATQWGGAIDIVNMNAAEPTLTSYINSGKGLKFNHVLYSGNRLFLSVTSSECGGAIGRAELNADGTEIIGESHIDRIGFPGASVNATAEYNGQMLAVSGYRGTYATFNANMEPMPYNYISPEKNEIEPMTEDMSGFGGKYVLSANGTAYVLYDSGEGAIIEDMNGNKTEIGVKLTSAMKDREVYNETTGEWVLTGETSNHYGKHTMAIKGDYAYVACGYNGLVGVNLSTGEQVVNNNLMTIGLCAYEDYLFTATASGLRIYEIQDNGALNLYAFEVESYDETTGMPTSDIPASIETSLRHSPNFVAYDPATGYIYVAYGQTGVRVYKFRTDDTPDAPVTDGGVDMGGDILWATEDLEGYYAWGEIFTAQDQAGTSFTYNGTTYTNDGSYYTFSGTNKTSYTDYTNYKFFDNTAKLTKYTWRHTNAALSEDGLTVLEPQDDAAVVRKGDGWRMPTAEEWVALINECQNEGSIEETTQDGVKGLLFTAANGNTIFLPQTGYYNYSGELKNTTDYYYWTSSLSTQINRNSDTRENLPGGFITGGDIARSWCDESLATVFIAYFAYGNLYIQKQGNELNGFDRCYGMKIRPVKDK
ncbi:MAG: hypothetical protein K2L50_01470 [Bacteroidales bacterium]|nr:hypothetical protein [Bacteroidales bacterium]